MQKIVDIYQQYFSKTCPPHHNAIALALYGCRFDFLVAVLVGAATSRFIDIEWYELNVIEQGSNEGKYKKG